MTPNPQSWHLVTASGLVVTWTPGTGLTPEWLARELEPFHTVTPTGPTEATTTRLGSFHAVLSALESLGETVAVTHAGSGASPDRRGCADPETDGG